MKYTAWDEKIRVTTQIQSKKSSLIDAYNAADRRVLISKMPFFPNTLGYLRALSRCAFTNRALSAEPYSTTPPREENPHNKCILSQVVNFVNTKYKYKYYNLFHTYTLIL